MFLTKIAEYLKQTLEETPETLLQGGEHYLIKVKDSMEARDAWNRQSSSATVLKGNSSIQIISRPIQGTSKDAKTLYPWAAFPFQPSSIDMGDSASSFLNLKAVKSASNTLWGMLRVHESRGNLELCCYVGRHLPLVNEVVDPQLRIPLKQRSATKEPLPFLFSDNPNLGSSLQGSPKVIDIMADAAQTEFKIHLENLSDEVISICEIVGRDIEGEEVDVEGLEVHGLTVRQEIKSGKSVDFTLRVTNTDAELPEQLVVSYLLGSAKDLDDEDLLGDDEVTLNLFGESDGFCHVFMLADERYELLKKALLNPQNLIEELTHQEEVSSEVGFRDTDDEADKLMLNDADLLGGSIGTVAMKAVISSKYTESLEAGQFIHTPPEEDDDVTALDERAFTCLGKPVIWHPAKAELSKSKRGKYKNQSVTIDTIYLGHMLFYNQYNIANRERVGEFLLNCVAVASLLRTLDEKSKGKGNLEINISDGIA